ncbi:hypothetical protein BEWA_029810 [Theileria equi strain WA]|uniref:Uncharacterized protein n=1 Tax=Theileria equi strain WA TaxID=1537102 RepID=L0AX43_THEEQ|nr:hypothetical protein BEWA_029810 [Theileria equi strain WA]AFZ80130.1 hypothetical protein BEWA_029810 [Theileria equi strain WA]|eukprot:XP_004829796.1 hypothetical protein BEWA_029810 [Theileria equi strain WA]
MSKVNPQINLSKKPKKDGGTGSYESGGTTFTVIKNDTGLPKGFFRHVHKPLNGPITLDRTLATSGDQIRGGFTGKKISSIDNVNEVSVYYWDGNDNVPILLGITTENGNPEKTKYHGRSGPGNPWMNGFVLSLSEKQALDNQNCHNNNTVVFNIQNPEFGTLNENSKISNCIRGKIKTSYIKLPSLPGSNYTIKEYAINGDASISRVTYGGRSTGITLNKGGGIDKVRVYFSAGSIEVPLLVEFLQRGGGESEWHYTQNTDGRNWTEVGKEKSKTFYSGPDQPTENLTTELDQIACSIGIGVTLDISYRNSETHARQSKKYCCDNHKDRVTVASGKINTGNHGHIMYYQHTIGQRYNLAAIKYH